jgi:hypothetical protein
MPDQAFVFSNNETLADQARTDPLGALGDGLELFFFGNTRPDRVGLWVDDWVAARRPPCESGMKQPPDGEEALSALVAFCSELDSQFPHGVPPWNRNTRGGFDFGLPATRPMLERLVDLSPGSVFPPPQTSGARTPARTAPDDIDDDAVRMLIAAVRELKAVSDHTFILRDIMNPAMLASLPTPQVTHWRDVAERIARDGGAPLLDFNDGTFVPSDFGDRTHLHPLAAERFSVLLAARVQPMAQENHASR